MSQENRSAANEIQNPAVSKGALWTGRILSGLIVVAMGLGSVASLFQPPPPDFEKYGYPASQFHPILIVALVSVILYAVPQTAVLGAILLTGYLGGAVATHVRVGEIAMMSPAVIVGVIVWLGLYLREPRLRALVPLRR